MNIVREESEILANLPSFIEAKKCAEILTNSTKGEVQVKDINAADYEIIHWKKNLFKVPSGKARKNFILELAKWLEHYNTKSNYQNIALKVFVILPALLQKPSKTSKAKDHGNKLEIRFQLWKDGNMGIYLIYCPKVVLFKKDYEISSQKIKEMKPKFSQS